MICQKHIEIATGDRLWGKFLIVSGIIYGTGLVLIIIGRIILYCYTNAGKRSNSVLDMDDDEEELYSDHLEQGWYLDLKEGAGNLVSAQTLQGRILVGLLTKK